MTSETPLSHADIIRGIKLPRIFGDWRTRDAQARVLNELDRAEQEREELLADPVYRGEGVPRGEGRIIGLIPGNAGDKKYFNTMAPWLEHIGHLPYLFRTPNDGSRGAYDAYLR